MITWREVADQYRDLMQALGLQVQQLQEQNALLIKLLQERNVKAQAAVKTCEVCGDRSDVGDHKQCNTVQEQGPVWDLTKDDEERKWDHGLEVYNRMREKNPEEDTPVVYSFGPGDNDFEETTYGALEGRYG
jgi:hypothetical protein